MRKTDLLRLPIYDNPAVDTFNLQDWNSANENIESFFREYANGQGAIPADLAERLDAIEDLLEFKIGSDDFIALRDFVNAIKSITDVQGTLILDKVSVNDFNALNATVQNFTADVANINTLIANKAEISELQAAQADIVELRANKADVDILNATNAEITNLKAQTAILEDVLAGNITAENISAGILQVINGWMLEGAIGNAQISDLSANKISAGDVDTSNVRIVSRDGAIEITGDQILINDVTDPLNPYNRITIGKVKVGENRIPPETEPPIDPEDPLAPEGGEDIEDEVIDEYDYSIVVRSKDGSTVMMDGTYGVYNAGITSGAIDDNKISDTANIAGHKLDINSVIREYNENGAVEIFGTKVVIGDRTLDVELSEQRNLVNEHTTELSTQKSEIQANTNAIALKVSSQDYTNDKNAMEQRLTTAESSINVMNGQIALKVSSTELEEAVTDLEGSIGSVNTRLSSAEQKITDNAIVSTVRNSTAYTTDLNAKASQTDLNTTNSNISALTTRVSNTESSITQQANQIALKVEQSDINSAVNNVKVGGRNLIHSGIMDLGGNTKDNTMSVWAGVFVNTTNLLKIIEPNTEYTMSFTAKITERTSVPTLFSQQVGFTFYSATTSTHNRVMVTSLVKDLNVPHKYTVTFTTPTELPSDYKMLVYTNRYTTNGANPIGFDTVQFTDIKLEKGNKATDYTPAPEDVDASIAAKANQSDLSSLTTRVSSAEQKITSDAIVSTVRSSTSYTSDLNAKASQSALNTTNGNISALTTRVTNAETSITQQAGQIALKVEQSHINTAINGLEIGGRNLLKESGIEVTNATYPTKSYYLTMTPIVDKKYTISLKGTVGTGKTHWGFYNSGGNVSLGTLSSSDLGTDGIYRKTFTWKNVNGSTTASDTFVNVYPMPNSVTGVDSTIEWIKLEEGTKATAFTIAPEDVDTRIDSVENSLSTAVEKHSASIEIFDDFITNKVSTDYVSKGELEDYKGVVASALTQTSTDITATFSQGQKRITDLEKDLADFKDVVETNITFDSNGITIGKSDSSFKTVIDNTQFVIKENDEPVAYINNNTMNITNAEIERSLTLGGFKFEPRDSGNLSLVWKR